MHFHILKALSVAVVVADGELRDNSLKNKTYDGSQNI